MFVDTGRLVKYFLTVPLGSFSYLRGVIVHVPFTLLYVRPAARPTMVRRNSAFVRPFKFLTVPLGSNLLCSPQLTGLTESLDSSVGPEMVRLFQAICRSL